ncbi:aspartyl-phosphate phosphatase Spo0E family protein [Pseudalkalibacillus caeni]|uniref:Aspartyl-phosphate phosphatase Spo0E family protein n=1 Tax=Exobacillus caeni TaxID=2574798 RepID=A0A5R9EVU7_9BACL|nr:aspartyl-phosphate phosphatase Spo0E family protein [Pseudalkalibacillus caeni]TLS34921.1 aspartyl-phosphate phosphatase Spo0E family protein [Pseudalkalibacillus caeni]
MEQKLLLEIEESRRKMNNLARMKPLKSSEIIEISTYLDQLLNQYERHKYRKTAAVE